MRLQKYTSNCNKYVIIEYQVSYYSQQIQADIMSLPATLQARYLSLTARMKIYGPHLGEPHTKVLGNGLLELRLKGAEGIARVFYCTMVGKQIVMLHSFVKKTQKIPFKEKRIAEIRMREVKNER